jgi:hypothetical protein
MRVSTKSKGVRTAKSKSVISADEQLMLLAEPQLLAGEDAAAYDQLLAHICAAVKPVDIIEKMFITDLVALEWEVLRWRRLKSSLIRARGLKALKDFLEEHLDYQRYSDDFEAHLTEILQDNLPGDQADSARTLASKCARNDSGAIHKVNGLLARVGLKMGNILKDVRANKAEHLVREYGRGNSNAAALIRKLIAGAGLQIDGLLADALIKRDFGTTLLDYIERIDHLTMIAERRRDASLREIDRRRAVFGETLRRSVREIEAGEFKVIETTPAKGKMQLDEQSQDQGQPRECAS